MNASEGFACRMTCRKRRGGDEVPSLVIQIVCILALQFVFRRPLDGEASYKLAVVLILIPDQPQRNCQITAIAEGSKLGNCKIVRIHGSLEQLPLARCRIHALPAGNTIYCFQLLLQARLRDHTSSISNVEIRLGQVCSRLLLNSQASRLGHQL